MNERWTVPRRVLGNATLEEFRTVLRGELISPNHAEYNSARRVWNGRIEKYPLLIVRCAGAADALHAVQFAGSQGLPIAIRGGGSSGPGFGVADDGVVIDFSCMKGMRVDPVTKTVRAEPGLTSGEFIRETQCFGLATTTGALASTGLAGLTLGGGLGPLAGKYGLSCDNLLAVDIVTADGQLLTASADENADLFWAVRGGGGNFGVVTSFKFQLHHTGRVLAGALLHPLARAREVLQFYRDYTRTAPDELTVDVGFIPTPDGEPVVALMFCYCGSPTEGERIIAPARRFGSPLADLIRPMPYLDFLTEQDASYPAGWNYYDRAHSLTDLGDEVIDLVVEQSVQRPSPHSLILLRHVHGAATRVAPDATALAWREERYVLQTLAAWTEGRARPHLDWVDQCWRAVQPLATAGTAINFLGVESHARVQASYGANYERLVHLKNRYDPNNLFQFNQNIRPDS